MFENVVRRSAAARHGVADYVHEQISSPGFDAIVGNPPFAGKNTIAGGNRAAFLDWLKVLHPESHGNADLVAHFS